MELEPRCAIIIPTYNHPQHLRRVVGKALSLGWPVFVIDDGSEEPVSQILTPLPGLTILRHERNLGKGAALLTGFAAAAPRTAWAVTIDADGQHIPEEIPSLVRAIPEGKRPLIIGKREGMEEQTCALDQPLGPKIFQLLGLGRLRQMVFRFPVRFPDLPPPGGGSVSEPGPGDTSLKWKF